MTKCILEALTWVARLCGGRFEDKSLQHNAKITELLNLVNGELREEPLVVWARYTDELEAIRAALRSSKRSTGLIYAQTSQGVSVPTLKNEQTVRDFQQGKTQILVIQPKALKMGVDLSRSSTAIYYSNYWDAEIRAQTEDRIVHPQKQEPVLIIDLVAADTPDEAIVSAVAKKRRTAAAFNAAIIDHLRKRRAA